MSRAKGIAAGLLAGVVAAVAMTAMMLLLACFGVATPLVIIGDRLSVFIPPGPFLSVMGKVGGFQFLARPKIAIENREFTPAIGRRAFMLSAIGVAFAGSGVALARKLYRVATFSYDGTQYKGRSVQPITPNDLFYCVTKNVVDPRVNVNLWHLEVIGLVQNRAEWRFQDLRGFPPSEQETTLMCISNGLDAGLISNAVWKGLPLRDLLDQAAPLSNAARVRLYGVDNYTDTIPLEKAMDPTTLLAYEMNGVPLPHRHGYPLRAIVPGYFGERSE